MKQLLRRSVCLAGMLLLTALPGYGLTVTGKVFFDKNSDGIMQASEAGLSQVAVSDGREVVLTDAQGSYRIETESGRFVFVSLPKGYRAAKGYYRTVENDKNLDFPMASWPETSGDSIRFVQITDMHVTNDAQGKVFLDDMADIGSMSPKPAFVVATGDIVDNGGQVAQLEALMRAVPKVDCPLFLGIGNHEVLGDGRANYRRLCGPEYYSFNAGNCHFVMLDSNGFETNEEQKAWLEKDLAAAPKGSYRIITLHHPPVRDKMRLFSKLRASLVLSGHWHGNRAAKSVGVLSLNTPSFRFGGIDRTPASFRAIDVTKGRVTSELKLTGQRKRATIVSPVGKVSTPGGKLNIMVNAYDSWATIDQVDCLVNGERLSLTKKGPWSWAGDIKADTRNAATQQIMATIYGANGKNWSASSDFRIDNKAAGVVTGADWAQWRGGLSRQGLATEAIKPPLKLAWTAFTGGTMMISSPMVSKGTVAIGVADLGNLDTCGIAAFDAKTGAPRWRFQTDSAIKGSVAIADGQVFAISVAGYLYAVDLMTGKLQWKAALYRDVERFEVASPTVEEGIVYAGGPLYLGAFEAKTGKRVWERSIKSSMDMKTGKKRSNAIGPGGDDWQPNHYNVPTPVGDMLLIASRNGLFAVEKATGEPIGKMEDFPRGIVVEAKPLTRLIRNTDGHILTGPVMGKTIYTVQSTLPVGISLILGEVLWSGTESLGDSTSTPALSGDKMVVGTGNGRVCAFSTKDGALLWKFQTGKALADMGGYTRGQSDVNSSPVISGDTVYVGSSDGCLYALSLATGEKLWSYSLGVPIASSPAISGNTLYIGAFDGNVYAFTGR